MSPGRKKKIEFMASPTFHFISGLPRSGSTLLSAILRQNPRFHADINSPLGALVGGMLNRFSAGSEHSVQVSPTQRRRLVRAVFDAYYEDTARAREVIFDTNRGWTARLAMLRELFPASKHICCVRNVAWIMDSFERMYRRDPYENTRLFNDDVERNTVYSRVDTLGQRNRVVGYSWSALKEAFYGEHAEALLVVDYDLLVQAPDKALSLIYQFIEQPNYEHDLERVEYDNPEFDRWLGVEDLHKVEGRVEPRPRRSILPPDLFEKYANMSFWRDASGSNANVIAAKPSEAA